jgi:hypothetical protein
MRNFVFVLCYGHAQQRRTQDEQQGVESILLEVLRRAPSKPSSRITQQKASFINHLSSRFRRRNEAQTVNRARLIQYKNALVKEANAVRSSVQYHTRKLEQLQTELLQYEEELQELGMRHVIRAICPPLIRARCRAQCFDSSNCAYTIPAANHTERAFLRNGYSCTPAAGAPNRGDNCVEQST